MGAIRVFPEVSQQLADESTYMGRFMKRAAAKPNILARISRDPEQRFISFLRTFSTGVDAERAANYSRADFYLEFAHNQFASFARNARFVAAIAARSGREDFIQATASELLLETHAAFLKGYSSDDAAETHRIRAQRHSGWVEHALPFTGLAPERQSEIRAWLHEHEIAAAEACGNRDAALTLFEQSLDRHSPLPFKNRYIECLFSKTLSELSSGEEEAQRSADAAVLEAAIQRFARFFDRVADAPLAFERLAELVKRRIAALVDAEDPGPRLAAFQRAVDADPFDLAIQAADVQWRFALSEAQEKFRELEAEAAAEGKVLNQQGVALRSMYTRGFEGASAYLASAQAKTVQAGLRNLTAHRLWRVLELPADPGWENRAVSLADAVGGSLAGFDVDDPGFVGALETALQSKSDIATLNARDIADRLRHAPPDTPDRESAQASVPSIVRSVVPFTPSRTTGVQTAEDFADWFFSPAGVSTRWASGIASVLLLLAAGLTVYDVKVSSTRDSLYPQIVRAARENRHEVVIQLAPEFLSARPLSGRTHSDEAVRQAYAEAVVALVAGSPGAPDQSLIQAAQRYAQVVGEPEGGNQ